MKTSDLPHSIPLVNGLEYLITTNIAPETGLAKGTRCTLITTIGDPSKPEMLELALHSYVPELECWPGKTKQSTMKDCTHFILKRMTRSISLSYLPATSIRKKTIPIKRHQFPLVPAGSFTNYRAEGQTIPRVITALRPTKKKSAKYVHQSRNHSFEDILLLDDKEITKYDLTGARNKAIDDEIIRLRKRHADTKKNIWSRFPPVLRQMYETYANQYFNQ